MLPIIIAIAVLAILGGLLGVGIGFAGKALYVEEDPRLDAVTKMLPGANCGGCGYPGCSGLANAIVFDGADPKNCKPGKPEMVVEIKKYLSDYEASHATEQQ